jgi:hypothetical protein
VVSHDFANVRARGRAGVMRWWPRL